MDKGHLARLRKLHTGKSNTSLSLFSTLVEDARYPEDIPDPYYGQDQGFENVLELIETAAKSFFKSAKES